MSVKSAIAQNIEFSPSQLILSTLQVLGASLFIAFCAQISIPLYFTPVPISGTTFAVMLVGACLGSRKGMLSVLAYLLEGAMGLPVFNAGNFGLVALFGVHGGYRLALPLQAYLVGWCMERQSSVNSLRTFFVLILSSAMVLGMGSLWLSHFVGLENAIMFGFLPFVIGDMLKCLCITVFLKRQENSGL
jgi:biotin transport system substrate-specific component